MIRLLLLVVGLYAACAVLIVGARVLAPRNPSPIIAAALPGDAVPVPPTADQTVTLPPGARLGDVLAALGPPDAIGFTRVLIDNQHQVVFRLYYSTPHLTVYGWTPIAAGRFDLRTPARTFEYRARPWTIPQLSFPWRGAGPFTRYYPQGTAAW